MSTQLRLSIRLILSFLIITALLRLVSKRQRTVLIISLDGFQRDYLARGKTPTLEWMIRNGISSSMVPVFPSITFPNHYSIATGLYPESHGIVSNAFYDSELNDAFDYHNDTKNKQSKWWKGEPIWITAQKSCLSSGVIMWPGSESQDKLPTFYLEYSSEMSIAQKFNQVFDWYQKYNIQLFMMYIPQVDQIGHGFGSQSSQLNQALEDVDRGISYFMNEFYFKYSLDWDILITSDHGMANTSLERVIYLDDIINMTRVTVYDAGPFKMLYPVNGTEEKEMYSSLRNSQKNYNVWNHESLPLEFHFLYKSRVGPIILQAHLGYVMTTRSQFNGTGVPPWPLGFHGYPSHNVEMHSIFIGYGPSFKNGKEIPSFSNVEIYQLISHLLNIRPSDHNGTEAWMKHINGFMNQ